MAADITGSSFTSLIQEHYDRRMLSEREFKNDLLADAVKAIIPKGGSDVIHWNRWGKFGRPQTVTDGTDLSTAETPTVSEVKGKLALFGDYVSITPYGDELRIASAIDESYDKMMEQCKRECNMRLQETLIAGDSTTGNSFTAAKSMYAGAATSFSELVSGGTCTIKSIDIQKAVGYLKKNGARGPIKCLLNPYSHEDLMIYDSDFRNLIKNQDLQILKTNELPQWAGAKMGWMDDPWREALASAGGASGTYAAAGAVVTTWVYGQESYGAVQLMGRGGVKPKFKVQDVSVIGNEVTIGYFMPFKGGALNADWIVGIRHVATNPEVSGWS